MIPLFFAAGQVNYTRWGLYYLHSMEALLDNVQPPFMKMEHIIKLFVTPWSGIWSDMRIEVPYNLTGKRAAGIIGQLTNMKTVRVWAYRLNAFCEVAECLETMKDKSSTNNIHKEEKNPEFHMIRLTEIFHVKNWKFPLISLMSVSMEMD